jgi:hypothetical protein
MKRCRRGQPTDPSLQSEVSEWAKNTEAFLASHFGASYVSRFHDDTGIIAVSVPCPNNRDESLDLYGYLYRLEQFSQEIQAP